MNNSILRVDKIERESTKAICIADAEGNLHWLPKSQITYNKVRNKIEIVLPKWLVDNLNVEGEFVFEEA